MGHRRIIEFVIVGLWLAIAVVLFLHYEEDTSEVVPIPDKLIAPIVAESNVGKQFDVQKITVLRGDSFDITMKNDNTRILGKLSVMATENAKAKVIDLINHSTNPKVVLRNKQPDGHWIIDLLIINDGKKINLVEWLSSNNLVYK